jgi:DNA-binding protein H-NS
MAATMSKILERLSALETEVKSLKEENELLKMVVPLPAITESLRCADSAEIKEWMEACQAVAEKFGLPASAAAAPAAGQKKRGRPAKKDPAEKRAATNPTGPAEWNRYKSLVWREMAAGYGITETDETKFKQLVKDYKKSHPEAVISYQEAMQEAKRRRCAEEGREYTAPAPKTPGEKKPAAAKKAEKKKPRNSPPMPPPDSDDESDSDSEAGEEDFASQLKALGISRKTISGEDYWVDQSNGEVFQILDGEDELGDRLGVYDADTDEIDTTA